MLEWLRQIFAGKTSFDQPKKGVTAVYLDADAELVELAALIESDDTGPEVVERIAKLLGQSDPNDSL